MDKLLNISDFKNKHLGQAAFCLGTAPHLNEFDLNLLKDKVTIGCNQLINQAEEYNFNYICFLRDKRFSFLSKEINKVNNTIIVIPESLLDKNTKINTLTEMPNNLLPVKTRFSTPGHAEIFSFDLNQCAYVSNIPCLQIQLAVWMGCSPIYILGVDAKYENENNAFYDNTVTVDMDVDYANKYVFSDFREWVGRVRTLLWARCIPLYDAGGEISSLDVLPRIHFKAAAGKPKIAVTSKTFCQDEYLVRELQRFFPDISLNTSKDKLQGDKLAEFLSDADGMILGTESFTAEVMEKLPCLRFVSKYGVGLNNIDFDAARRHNIQVSYKKGINSDSVSELVLGLTLNMLRKIDQSVDGYRKNNWCKLPGRELAEMTVGVIGYGHVGKVVAEKFALLGVGRLLVNDLLDFPVNPPAEFVPLEYLITESDIITIHVSLEKQNYYLVNKDFLSQMKQGSFLVNTSRGEVVDETALAESLKSGHLGGAALDVYEHEPQPNPVLCGCPNLLTTCHIAGSSNRAIKNMGWAAIEGLLEFCNREPI